MEVSVKFTGNGATPELGDAVKLAVGATGGFDTVMVTGVADDEPAEFDAVIVT